MKSPRQIFHYISYLQYPLIVVSLVLYIPFIISLGKQQPNWGILNYVLTIFGVAVSFSTLQDTTKVQNKFSKNIWQSPKKGKVFLILLASIAFLFITVGLALLYTGKTEGPGSIAVGLLVLGIGLIGMLKSAVEMFEHQQIDKQSKEKH